MLTLNMKITVNFYYKNGGIFFGGFWLKFDYF